MSRFNNAKMTSTTTGTSDLALVAAVTGYQTFADAGVDPINWNVITYRIDDGAAWEVGVCWTGDLGGGSWQLQRSGSILIESSDGAGVAINCSGNETVSIVENALQDAWVEYYGNGLQTITNGSNVILNVNGGGGDDEYWYGGDPLGIIVGNSSGTLTIGKTGLYHLKAYVKYSGAGTMSGKVTCALIDFSGNPYPFQWNVVKYYNSPSSDDNDTMVVDIPTIFLDATSPDTIGIRLTNNAGETLTINYYHFIIKWVGEYS